MSFFNLLFPSLYCFFILRYYQIQTNYTNLVSYQQLIRPCSNRTPPHITRYEARQQGLALMCLTNQNAFFPRPEFSVKTKQHCHQLQPRSLECWVRPPPMLPDSFPLGNSNQTGSQKGSNLISDPTKLSSCIDYLKKIYLLSNIADCIFGLDDTG